MKSSPEVAVTIISHGATVVSSGAAFDRVVGEQAGKRGVALDFGGPGGLVWNGIAERYAVGEALMRAFTVVMPLDAGEHMAQVRFAQEDQLVLK